MFKYGIFDFLYVHQVVTSFARTEILLLVSTIFDQIFIFSPNDSPSQIMKTFFLFHLNSFLRCPFFCNFSLFLYTIQTQKEEWKWNNS